MKPSTGRVAALGAAFCLFAASAAHATPIFFEVILSGANEVPAVVSPGAGSAIIVLDPTAQTLQLISVSFAGLTSGDEAAHIHCCAPLGTNVGVAITVSAFPLFPLGVTSGFYSSPVFDLTQPLIYNPAFVTLEGGLAQAEAALIAGLQANQAYFDIHTANFPGGEIRGQVTRASVPEPATLALLGMGSLD